VPLLDHFRAPLFPKRHWESFHCTWSATIADALNKRLPEGYFAERSSTRENQCASAKMIADFREDFTI
jgi:hypothetical protein